MLELVKTNPDCAKSSTLDKIRSDNSFLSYLLSEFPSSGDLENAIIAIDHQKKLIENLQRELGG